MAEISEGFDLDNPKLPKSIQRAALGSGDFPYDETLDGVLTELGYRAFR